MNSALPRRSLLHAALGITGSLALLRSSAARADDATSGAAALAASPGAPSNRAWYDLGLTSDPVLNDQLLHYLAATYSGQADVGEVLDTGTRIDPGDAWSWPNEWVRTADRIEAMAAASVNRGHLRSAGKAYLRAANYYRAALIHHPEPHDPSVRQIGQSAVSAYDKAILLLQWPALPVRVPYENTTLPGYFFRAKTAWGNAPLIVFSQGRDAWPEESKYVIDDALERGYHVLIVHCPGQAMALREQGLAFRPDWEKVISPIVDFGVRISGVDPRRIALLGWSMSGALTPRAAAFDKRIKVLIANPGVLNWGQANFVQIEQMMPGAIDLLNRDPAAFDAAIQRLMDASMTIRWEIVDTMWKHGARSPSDLMFKMRDFNNEPVVGRIACRTLVMDGTGEQFTVGQAKLLYDALKCPKDYLLFTAEDTALLHCQEAAVAVADHRMFDWLDEVL